MSIRLKLLISYAAMLIVPLILMVVTALLFVFVYRGDIQNIKSFYETQVEGFDDGDYHHIIKHLISQNSTLLTDPSYLADFNEEMKQKSGYVVVRLNDSMLFVPELIRVNGSLLASLPQYNSVGFRGELPTQSYGNELFQVNQFDFLTQTGGKGSLYLVIKVDPLVYFARKYFPSLFAVLVVILVLTHSFLTYVMSKSIIRPLRQLRSATQQIKNGNLNFQVKVSGKDEIGQLGNDFEEMRSQLQKSILLQLQYEENRKELISNISHDLKTPLTSIQGYVDGILEGVADSPEKTEKYMKTIAAKAEEMDRLINELFLFSKLDLKRIPFIFEVVPVQMFMTDWTEELQFELEKMDIHLGTTWQLDHDATVLMDREKFKRVLSNVIQNSLKYMDKEEKRISIRATSTDWEFHIEIEDNGSGIAASSLPHIFDRFYRAEQSRNSSTGGSGLGLAIAKQIMESHGGTIAAESKEGVGTIILLTLPLQAKEVSV
ncbi:sensor histidine kinase [Cohnella candidum]|uniref:histidine kinase n=1 Tax=Cohnella candidum TaxID=2674991 RepID=A0A3G3JX49_9BACL|nr:HAMP domain-containing sensor histidine kinase [Cohnella candidum]AYQ72437.1 sensor histidine kinase [Cohnella candidum]